MEYYEKKTKVEAFQIKHNYTMDGKEFKSGDYIVINGAGVGKLMSREEFEKRYTEKEIVRYEFPVTKIEKNPFEKFTENFGKPYWQQPHYYGDPPFFLGGGTICQALQ